MFLLLSRRAMNLDVCSLKSTAVSLLSDFGYNASTLAEEFIKEMCSYGDAELRVVAAGIGGGASQEVINVKTTHKSNRYLVLIYDRN
ncbi:hypothetical protein E3N88_38767 [Mikania micrantha]|uniref:Uncharacterized protein n=1 Tax=Mikania micrantha TaxID=192012 RepID=A0A5N6LV49_9ASTR|nr:hypothetical protein E3N88_38767 [Mikania micrantha]